MKKAIIYLTMALVLMIAAAAQTMIREIPSSVNPGATFNVRYQAQDVSGNFGVLIDDSASGGCTPNSITTGFLGPATYADISVTAPASGTCTFTGTYQFADATGTQPEKIFQSQSVTVASETCTPSTWSPSRSNHCIGTSFTQTSNCGTTRTSTGTKACDTGSTGDTSKSSGSGGIFIIIAAGIILFLIAVKSIPR